MMQRKKLLVIGFAVVVSLIIVVIFIQRARQKGLDLGIVAAAERGDFTGVLELLERGADPDGSLKPSAVFPGLQPPLYYAAKAGELGVAKALLDGGADMRSRGLERTLLRNAILLGDMKTYAFLLEVGADPNGAAPMSPAYNVLHTIVDAVWRSELSEDKAITMAELGIQHGADPNRPANDGVTPLHYAVTSEQESLARLMLDHGADLALKNEGGRDAMDIAAFRENADLVSLLAERGAPYTIQEAVALGNLDRVEALIDADASGLEMECFHKNSPLGLALANGHSQVANLLIEAGADFAVRNDEHESLLHLAAKGGSAEMVSYLLDQGLDANDRDRRRETPLHETTFSDRVDAARVLIEAGARINAEASSKITPLLWAASYDSPGVVNLLIEAGADPNNPAAYDGALPLGSACHYSGTDSVPESVVALIAAGAEVNKKDASGQTALHWAVDWHGGVPLATYLLDHGADPTIADGSGNTALDLARSAGKTALENLFVSRLEERKTTDGEN